MSTRSISMDSTFNNSIPQIIPSSTQSLKSQCKVLYVYSLNFFMLVSFFIHIFLCCSVYDLLFFNKTFLCILELFLTFSLLIYVLPLTFLPPLDHSLIPHATDTHQSLIGRYYFLFATWCPHILNSCAIKRAP